MKPVIGVFDDDDKLTQALDALYQHGFDKEQIHLAELEDSMPINLEHTEETILGNPGLAMEPSPLVTFNPLLDPDAVPGLARQELRQSLADLDVPDQELDFLVDTVMHGGKLVVISADQAWEAEARALLRTAHAERVV